MTQRVARLETDPWLRRAQAGNTAAWGPILERYGASVYGLCCRLDPSPDDCCQEVWTKVFTHIQQFDPGRGHFLGWVHTIAHRHIIDRRRHRGRRGRPEPLPATLTYGAPSVETRLSERARARLLEDALQHLPEAHRHVIVMHHLSGLPLDEIAQLEGVAVGTIKSRLHRARAGLALLLREKA